MSLALNCPGRRVHRLFTFLPLDIFIFLCYNNIRKTKEIKKMIYRVAGGFYHNYENAYDAAREMVDKADLYEFLQVKIDLWDLLDWCLQNDAFLEHFEEQILEAENEAVTEFYLTELEFDSEKEEEEFETSVEFLDEEE